MGVLSVGDSGSALKAASDGLGLDRVKAAAQSITSVLGKIALTSAEMIAPSSSSSADLTSSSSSSSSTASASLSDKDRDIMTAVFLFLN